MAKNILITGASRGIGKAIAIRLARDKHKIFIGYRSQQNKAEEVVDKIKHFNGESKAVHCDISKRESIRKALEETGEIDILINNAGISQTKSFLDISDEDLINMINTNLIGAFIFSQEVIPAMIKNKWGRIINITSIGGQWGGVNQVHYASAKAGLIGLTMSLARIFSCFGVTTNAISPGVITTEMTAGLGKNYKTSILNEIPIGRFGSAEEVAEVAAFLASEASSYITGQTINVNGGMLRK